MVVSKFRASGSEIQLSWSETYSKNDDDDDDDDGNDDDDDDVF
jgi:hypothetical protein